MLLVAGSPGAPARRDRPARERPRSPAYAERARDVRPDPPAAQRPAPRDPRGGRLARRAPLLGRRVPRRRRGASWPTGCACSSSSPARSPRPTPRSPPRRRPRPRWPLRYSTNAPAAPGETPRDALARRLVETADKEVWNGSTLVGPHRDDLVFELAGRDLAGFASRGQQRTAILALKLAELDLLTALDGRPPLLLLDDVFSELDPDRRSHLVRRIAALPQAFVTTTTLDDLDPELRAIATTWEVRAEPDGARLVPDAAGAAGRP